MLITEESKAKEGQPSEMKQQGTFVSSVEPLSLVAHSFSKVEPKTAPYVDEGFDLVLHLQNHIAATSVSFSSNNRPFSVQETVESLFTKEVPESLSVEDKEITIKSPFVSQCEPAVEAAVASDTSPVPSEVPVQSPIAAELEMKKEPAVLDVESQTGNSLLFDQYKNDKTEFLISEVTKKDEGTICNPPVDMEVQTELSGQFGSDMESPVAVKKEIPPEVAVQTASDTWTSPAVEMQKNKIHVFQKKTENEETIEIATKAGIGRGESLVAPTEESNVLPEVKDVNSGEDILVEVKYKGQGQEDSESVTSTSELNIVHTAPQSFETVLVDPDESTTEVIVDKDGNQKIVVRKVRRIVISQQQQHTVQQSFQTFTSSDTGGEYVEVPVTQSVAFSQVTLQGQQKTVSENQGDGMLHVTSTQSYVGSVSSGIPGGGQKLSEFSAEPQHQTFSYHTVSGEIENLTPPSLLLKGVEIPEISGDGYTVVEPSEAEVSAELQPEHAAPSQPEDQGSDVDGHITTSSSCVHAVVEQVTRKVTRRIRRVIRHVVIIDGKEHVTEEVVEEPEEVEVTEEVPRVRVEVSRTGGLMGQQILDFDLQKQYEQHNRSDIPGQEHADVPIESHHLGLQESENFYGNVMSDLEGKLGTEIQDVHLVKEPSSGQKELTEGGTDGQSPVEKQEHTQREEILVITVPGLLHEGKEETAEDSYVNRLFEDTLEEVLIPDSVAAKTMLATAEELEEVSKVLPDTGEPLVQDKSVVETDSKKSSSLEVTSHHAASEFGKDHSVIAVEELIERDVFGNVATEEEKLHIMTGTEEVLPDSSSVFESHAIKCEVFEPKTESEYVISELKTKEDSDVTRNVREHTSEMVPENVESLCITQREAVATAVTDIPIASSSDTVLSLESGILPGLEETQATQESYSHTVMAELEGQGIGIHNGETKKYIDSQSQDATAGENIIEETASICELGDAEGAVANVTSEKTVGSENTQKPHMTVEDGHVAISQLEPLRITGVGTSELSEDEYFTSGIVGKSITQSPKPSEFQETLMKSDVGVSKDVTSQTSPEHGVKTIEFALSIKEKPKTSFQQPSELAEVSAAVKVEEKELTPPSEDKRDEPCTGTVPEHKVVQENIEIQFPGTKTVSYSVTEETATCTGLAPTSLKTDIEARDDTSMKSEAEIGMSKRSRSRKKHKAKGIEESSPEEPAEAEQVDTPEQTPGDVICDVQREVQTSLETSLAESTEIIIPGSSPSSSDTTKPTEQEDIMMMETPISPPSPRDSEMTHDTGYDPEDKTTLDEMSVIEEGDKRKNKKKKKKKQKVKAKDSEESTPVFQKSSIEPVVGQAVVVLDIKSTEKDELSKEIIREVQGSEPDEASRATSDSTAEKVTVEERGTESKGKKSKKDGKEPDVASEFKEPSLAFNLQFADTHSPEFHDDSYRELKSEEVDSVKVIAETAATRPPSEAVEALVDSEPKPVEVWELLHVQEQSAQTVTPDIPKSPDAVVIESSVQTSSEHVAVTCEDYAQTMTPEMHVVEKTETADFSVQTLKEDLTSTQEECVQTKTPEVVDVVPVVTGEMSIQTLETEPATTHEEAAQTSTPEATELVAVDSMESSIQTKTEEIVPVQEDSVQTLTPEVPVTDTKDTSVQAVHTDLTPMLEGSVQTVTPEPTEIPEVLKVETFEMSIQTSKEMLDPVCEKDVDTVAEETPLQTVEMSCQTREEYSVETQEGTAQTVSPEVPEIMQIHTFDSSIQTVREEMIPTTNEYSQTISSQLPQVHTAEIAEISTQTTKTVPSTLEEYAQTLSPDIPDVTDSFIQTLKEELIPTEEQCSQTATVEKFQAQNIEMADSSVWTVEEDMVPKSDEFSPTVPPVVTKPEEQAVFQGLLEPERTEMADVGQMGEEDVIPTQSLPETTVSHVLFIPIDTKVETAETSIQTKPVFVTEYGDERSQSSSSEEPYEIHVQASVSFTPSVESGDIGKIGYHTDRKRTTSGDNIGSGLCESEQDEDVCYTVETLLKSDDEKSAQFTGNVLGMPAMEEEPVIGVTINTDGNIEPNISDLAQTQLREDKKQAVYEFIASEIAAELREREDKHQGVELEDQTVPNLERAVEDTAVTQLKCTEPEKEKYPSLEDVKLKQKEMKEVQNLDGGSTEHVSSQYQEQTKSPESPSEPIDSEEAHLVPEACVEDASELESETVTARIMNEKDVDEIVITTEPEVTTEMKLQHPEVPTSKKTEISEEHSDGQESPAGSKLVISAELPVETQTLEHKSDVEIPSEFRQSYSDTAKLSSKPVDHMGTVFLTEDHKVSVQPVRGEHSPGPPVIHEEVVTIFSPDPSSSKEIEPTGPEPVSSSVNEQFLMELHEPVVDINVESNPTYVKENISDFGTAEITQEKSVPLTGAYVIPVATSEQFILQERSCSDRQVIELRDSEDEMDLLKCKSPVMIEDISEQFEPKEPSDIVSIADEVTAIQWKKASNVLSGRLRDLQNARKTTHMSRGMYLVTLEEIVTEELVEQRRVHVQNNLSLLQSAVEKKDVVIIQKTIIKTVETISVWLETIEYRIYLNREKTNTAPTQEHMKEYDTLKEEINSIEVSVAALEGILETASGVCSEDDKIHLRECLASLQEHVQAIDEIAQESEEKVAKDLVHWEEFLNGVNNISVMVEELKQQLEELIQSDISVQLKLQELEKIESINRCHILKTTCLLKTARSLVRDFPGRDIPPETFTAHETTRIIEHSIALERDRLLQLLSLADDYEQTLKEFSQIIDVADTLVDSPISVINLEHLQEEMQKHRKFFVNLSHCRGILESLEGNLDPDTRALHSQLHQTLHCRATAILDKAASRAQQMALAASRWTVLEQGMKEERGWLQVAHQRVPDLQTVSSPEYDQYISLYQVSTIA